MHGIETGTGLWLEHEHTTQERIAIRNLADASQVVYQLMLPDA
jgi:tripeptide aminopeptidase